MGGIGILAGSGSSRAAPGAPVTDQPAVGGIVSGSVFAGVFAEQSRNNSGIVVSATAIGGVDAGPVNFQTGYSITLKATPYLEHWG